MVGVGVQVQVKSGYSRVWLYGGGVFDSGAVVTLSSSEYAALSTAVKAMVTVLSSTVADPVRTAVDPIKPPNSDLLPIYLYGASYAILGGASYYTAGKHYSDLLAARINGGARTSYAVSGRRIADVVSTLVNGGGLYGVTGVIAAGKWPGTSSRTGLVVFDIINDIGHYPVMNVSPTVPAKITSADTKYLDGIKGMYRAALAVASSESRVEHSTATMSGTWTQNSPQAYASGGYLGSTTAAGAYIEYTVTPAQSGPLAGKVFHLSYKVDASAGTMAAQNISVDGGAATAYTPTAWEMYTGHNGSSVNVAFDCVAITVPVDGAAHTVRITHAGSAGQLLYSDCILIPSTDPNPIAVMGAERPPVVHTGVFDAAGVNAWRYNLPLVTNAIKTIVSEFPHAFYVPSTMTSNGLSSGDGLHPNDRGMAQRAADLQAALTSALRARLETRVLANQPNSDFSIV